MNIAQSKFRDATEMYPFETLLFVISSVFLIVGMVFSPPLYWLGGLTFLIDVGLMVRNSLNVKKPADEPKIRRRKLVAGPNNEPIVTAEETELILSMALLANFGKTEVRYYRVGKAWEIDIKIPDMPTVTLIITSNKSGVGYLGYLDENDRFKYMSRDDLNGMIQLIKEAADKKKQSPGKQQQNQPQQGQKVFSLKDCYKQIGNKHKTPPLLSPEAEDIFAVIETDNGMYEIVDTRT